MRDPSLIKQHTQLRGRKVMEKRLQSFLPPVVVKWSRNAFCIVCNDEGGGNEGRPFSEGKKKQKRENYPFFQKSVPHWCGDDLFALF